MGDLGSIPGLRRVPPTHSSILAEKSGGYSLWGRRELDKMIAQLNTFTWASLVAQTVKYLPAMRETWVRSLGQEDPLEKEMATHSSTLA